MNILDSKCGHLGNTILLNNWRIFISIPKIG